jgi:type IV pilus assembly protein PilC
MKAARGTGLASAVKSSGGGWAGWAALRFGRQRDPKTIRMPRATLAYVLRNLATLLQNGVPLPKSICTLGREQSLKRHAGLMDTMQRYVEVGNTLSSALREFPTTFDEVMINQVRAAEKAGTLAATLDQIARQLEKSSNIRSQILRKLAYPAVLVVGGSASVTFLLVFVVPLFKQTYAEIGMPLPWITRAMLMAGQVASSYGWIILLALIGLPLALPWIRRNPAAALAMDRALLRLPGFGPWLRAIAVLQFIEVFGNMLQSGFTVAESLRVSARVVRNLVLRRGIEELQAAVVRGERFSRELDRLNELFPPVVSQLIMVGEQTGNLPRVVDHIADYLRRQTERFTVVLAGTLEPVLTISLAGIIACILLAIYLPMFDMIGASRAH